MVTSLKITEDAVEFSNEGTLVGKLYKRQMDPQNIAEFTKANYNLQGTVKYDAWVAGAFAGLSLLLGEHMMGPEDRALTGDGSGEAAPPADDLALFVDAHPHKFAPGGEFSSEPAKELLPGEIVVPGHTVIDGKVVESVESPAVSEAIVPVSESPAAVGETIAPVSESPAVASEETRGLTPPGSPATDAAGAVSP